MISLDYSLMGIIAVSGSFKTSGDSPRNSSIDSKDGFNNILPPSIVPGGLLSVAYFSLFKFLVLNADNYDTCALSFYFCFCGEATIFSCFPYMMKGSKS